MPVSNNLNGFLSVISYFGKWQNEQHRQEINHPAVGIRSVFDLCVQHRFEISSLCNLCVLCVSVVNQLTHHRGTEDTEEANQGVANHSPSREG